MPALTPAAARVRLVGGRVGHLSTVRPDGAPHVVPVCFAVVGDVVYSATDAKPKRTAELQRMANIEREPRVSLLVDHWDEDWARLWWVRADGIGRAVDPTTQEDTAARAALRAKYPQYDAGVALDGVVLALDIATVTGWSFS